MRAANAQIAAAYDKVSYDPDGAPHVDPAYVRPLAAIFGLNPEHDDVLDLGCGFGAHTVRMSRASKGRVVGLDLSKAACERARRRFAEAGREADIRCVDVMDVKAEDLGQFDLIACVGVLYVTPEPVRTKMFELMGQCLRPGGACLISFYAGLSGYAACELQRLIRAKLGAVAPSLEALPAIRAFLRGVVADFKQLDGDAVVAARAEHMLGLPDGNLFHEVFGPPLLNFTARTIHDALTPHGIQIAGIIPYDLAMLGATPDSRALSMDILDLMRGGYRYALFGKWEGKPPAADFDTPMLAWRSSFQRRPEAGEYAFLSPATGVQVEVREPHLGAFLDVLAEGPRRWSEATALARQRVLAQQPQAPFDETVLKRDVVWLWQSGGVQPGFPGLPHPGFD